MSVSYSVGAASGTNVFNRLLTATQGNHLNADATLDAVNKIRVSTPQTLIDTDFEYGLQPTKWETLQTVNNIPTFFRRDGDASLEVLDITATDGNTTIKVTTTTAHELLEGSPIIVVGSSSYSANGSFVVSKVNSATEFLYRATIPQTATGSIYEDTTTFIYPGRLFQGIYIQKDAKDIVTNNASPNSILTVETNSAHGLSANTTLVLANSTGIKRVLFDASLVNFEDTSNVAFTVDTTADVAGSTGYLKAPVVPYDFQSKKTYFFTSNNVDLASDTITLPAHGLNADTYLMYTKPVGDAPFGGLSDFGLYKTNVVDTSTIALYPVQSTILDTGNSDIVVREYNNNIDTITDVLAELREVTVISTTLENTFDVSLAKNQTLFKEYIGYVKSSGTSFTITATLDTATAANAGVAYWVGKRALRNATTNYTYFKNYNNASATIASTNPEEDPAFTVNGEQLTFTVTPNVYYPFRARLYARRNNAGSGAVLSMASLAAAGGAVFAYKGTESLAIMTSGSVANITAFGTHSNGDHALHKVFPITSANVSTNVFTLDVTGGTNNAALVINEKVNVFSDGFGPSDTTVSFNHVSGSTYTQYLLGTASGSNIVLQTAVGQNLNVQTDSLMGASWILPAFQISEYDSIYYPSHGLIQNDAITYTLASGTGPDGLISGSTYFAEPVNTDYFRLKETTNGTTVDIASHGNGNLTFEVARTYDNKNSIVVSGHDFLNGETITYSNQGFPDVPGLSNGFAYAVTDSTANTFKLAYLDTAAEVDITAAGSNVHAFTAAAGATDGSYAISQIISDNVFNLNAGFYVPSRELTVDGTKNVIISSANAADRLYLPDHRLTTGSTVRLNGGSTVYYAIRDDMDHVRLAATYANSVAGTSISLEAYAGSQTNTLFIDSVKGSRVYSSNVTLTSGSPLVTVADVDFLALERVGDTFIVEVPTANTVLTVSSVDTGQEIIGFTTDHNLTTGDYLFYQQGAGTTTDVVDGGIYYVSVVVSSSVRLHLSYADAVLDQTYVNLSTLASTYGTFIKRPVATVYNYAVSEVHNKTNLSASSNYPVSSTNARYILESLLFPRADGFALHRPFDGGVELIPASTPDSKIIRQTRRYFRYQSGKSMQLSKAVNFNAPTEIESLTRSGSTATVVTRRPHRLKVSTPITIEGANDDGWNGQYSVIIINDIYSFSFTLEGTLPIETRAGGFPIFRVTSWTNCSLRVGLFDDQNGMFFEYDGAEIYAVRRRSTLQLFGTATATFLSKVITGRNTSFTTQLNTGDSIVIKGQSYKISKVVSDSTLVISPPYRGSTFSNIVITKTVDTRVARPQWSLDPCDGTGVSGYNFDPQKIQMIYIDYAWYGAGKIRFGFKGVDAKVFYCHEFIHNNTMNEAYFRSGNLPARYEVQSNGTPTYVPVLMHWGTSVIMDGLFDDDKAYFFTAAGSTLAYTGGDSVDFTATLDAEAPLTLVPGTSESGYKITLTNSTEYQKVAALPEGTLITGANIQAGTTTVGTAIQVKNGGELYLNKPPTADATGATLTAGDPTDSIPELIPLVSIRLAPSVDNSLTGAMGIREVINRMQLTLRKAGILTTHDVEITLYLNGIPFYKTYEKVTPPSLSQLIRHVKGDSIEGGVELFTFSVSGGTADANGARSGNNVILDLEELATLGNSILGGDDVFPNGPDLLTIGAKILDRTNISVSSPFKISGRLSWSESQA